MNEELLQDIMHELASIDGWKAFEPDSNFSENKEYTVILNDKEYVVDLDFGDLIKRIEKELGWKRKK